MFKVHLEREIAVSHQLKKHEGKCQNLHGHNFQIEVDVWSKYLIPDGSSEGMVIDFGDIKQVIDFIDHQHLNSCFSDSKMQIQPTAERLAEYIAKKIKETQQNIVFEKIVVKVQEARGQWVEYEM